MIIVGEEQAREILEWEPLIKAIQEAFKANINCPPKHQHFVKVPGELEAKIMMMPAWCSGKYICIKLVNMFPGNENRDVPTVCGVVILFDARTGQPLIQIDGGEVTARRTAATSALAASYLARQDSKIHLIVGTGRIAWNLIFAHRNTRSIDKTFIWGRKFNSAVELAALAKDFNLNIEASESLEEITRSADIISCATYSPNPIINGNWLSDGVHLDLVGGYRPDVRETDDVSIERSTVFCDTLSGAPISAGDLTQPIASGLINLTDLVDLYSLVRGLHPGRKYEREITLFKSVGASLEDYAAAVLIYQYVKG